MKTTWTPWAAKRQLPFPGEAHVVAVDVKKSAARVAKAGGGEVPAIPDTATEARRAANLRVHERYNEAGNIPTDALGDDLVDLWVARRGVGFALEAVIATAAIPRIPRDNMKRHPHPYVLRRDGRPWPRMRRHIAAAGTSDRDRALAIATAAWTDAWKYGESELPFALAFLTCNPSWVDRVVEQTEDKAPRYGQQCILAGITDPERGSRLVRACFNQIMGYLTEEGLER